MKIFASTNDKVYEFDSTFKDGKHIFSSTAGAADYDLLPLGNGRYSLLKNGQSLLVQIALRNNQYHVRLKGEHLVFEVEDERMRKVKELVAAASSGPTELNLQAPIPGVIVQVPVEEGASIKKGQPLVILEAMKMENVLKATCDCVVEKVLVNAGQAVQQNQELLRLVSS